MKVTSPYEWYSTLLDDFHYQPVNIFVVQIEAVSEEVECVAAGQATDAKRGSEDESGGHTRVWKVRRGYGRCVRVDDHTPHRLVAAIEDPSELMSVLQFMNLTESRIWRSR